MDSLMHEILFNACPEQEFYSELFDTDIQTFRIVLHCAEYLIDTTKEYGEYKILYVKKVYT